MSMHTPSNFQLVSEMNEAFGNPKGDRLCINKAKLKAQCENIKDELKELMDAIEANDTEGIRDALCDIHVFAYGAHHLMGLNADADMEAVLDGVYSRFVKNQDDLEETLTMHYNKGVQEVYFEGEFPTMVVKSAKDQPDAPKGKFLKSASYQNTVFVGAAMFEDTADTP